MAALSGQPGIIRIVQVHGDKEHVINCDVVARCEFISSLQWSPDSNMLYIAPLLTGEDNISFKLYTGLAGINLRTGELEKRVEDSQSDMEYDASLSPARKYIAYTHMRELYPGFTIIETGNLKQVFNQTIEQGIYAENIFWTPDSQGIIFVSVINCESSVYFFDMETKMLYAIIEKDPSCVQLLSVDESQVAFLKSTTNPLSTSYWYLNPITKILSPVSLTPE